MHLTYLANSRLPTEHAHGHQIVKMCEAFSALGLDVHLLHPFRIQRSPSLQGVGIAEHYGLKSPIRVTTVPAVDLVRFTRFMPRRLAQVLLSALRMRWSRRVVKALLATEVDACFTREVILAYWAQRYGLPTVLELHREPKWLNRLLLRRCVREGRLAGVVTLTEELKRRLSHHWPAGRSVEVLTCPDAVDLRLFENLPDRDECRRILGLPADRRIVGYVGRFQSLGREKGLPQLIQAIPHLGPVRDRCLLLCVGGPMRAVPCYQKVAVEAGVRPEEVRFVDRVPPTQVPLWIRACDVVTIPWPRTEFSAYFTSPLKLFEYMAAEVPIVATDLESLREVLSHEETALLAEPGSPASLGHSIRRVLTDESLGRRLSTNARERVQQFTWDKRADRIYRHLLAKAKPRMRTGVTA